MATIAIAHSNGEAAVQPETQLVPLALAAPEVKVAVVPHLERETLLAGVSGEERRDAAFRYNSDGSVRATIVYFYGGDARAARSQSGDPLRREAVYLGRVDPLRLHAARKLSDTYYAGPVGHERRDVRIEYHADADGGERVARTVVFYYEGDVRAAEAPSGAAVRREVAYDGLVR